VRLAPGQKEIEFFGPRRGSRGQHGDQELQATSAGRRFATIAVGTGSTANAPHKPLLDKKTRTGGRDNRGLLRRPAQGRRPQAPLPNRRLSGGRRSASRRVSRRIVVPERSAEHRALVLRGRRNAATSSPRGAPRRSEGRRVAGRRHRPRERACAPVDPARTTIHTSSSSGTGAGSSRAPRAPGRSSWRARGRRVDPLPSGEVRKVRASATRRSGRSATSTREPEHRQGGTQPLARHPATVAGVG